MMNNKTVTVSLHEQSKSYDILIGAGIFNTVSTVVNDGKYSAIYIITDTHVGPLYLQKLERELKQDHMYSFVFEAGEQNKTLETVQRIYEDMAKNGIDRKSLVINLGGGVVTDLGGFAASTFMRGVPFINIATTLEGMVDASVGGKTGVNLGTLKNYVGVFSQPLMTVADIDVLKTLPERVFLQGYAEVIKHGLIDDKVYFEEAVSKSPLQMNSDELIQMIYRSVKIKSHIVMEDEHEKAARKLLNFGHTIGHVIESLSLMTKNPLFHGEAVSIGMIAEAYISCAAGMISRKTFLRIENGIRSVGLPTRYTSGSSIEDIVSQLRSDKKNEHGAVKWTLLSDIGKGEFNVSIGEHFVRQGVEYILQK